VEYDCDADAGLDVHRAAEPQDPAVGRAVSMIPADEAFIALWEEDDGCSAQC
jgi:hypothetical protein